MSRYIVKVTDDESGIDYYMDWSSIIDAPVTYGLSLEEFKKYYKEEYGEQGLIHIDQRLERVREKGCSSHDPTESVDNFMKHNHAGDKGECLTKEQILELYCHNRPKE